MTTNGATPAGWRIWPTTWRIKVLGKNGDKVKILVIDDDAVACEFLQEALRRAGYEVDTFTSAREALEGDLSRYDLLMSDIRMPDIDGLQFLRQVHEKWPQLPVILMTAFGSLETTMEALRLGAWDYISKPFSPEAIRAMVQKVLEISDLQQHWIQGQPEVGRSRSSSALPRRWSISTNRSPGWPMPRPVS